MAPGDAPLPPADPATTAGGDGGPATPDDPTPDDPTPDAAFRLPRTVEPVTYRLTLAPDLEAATFTGTAEIEVEVRQDTDRIVVNAADLDISGVELACGGRRLAGTVALDDEAERATFTFGAAGGAAVGATGEGAVGTAGGAAGGAPADAGPIPAGPATLRLSFTGVLNDKLRGFYRSTFTDQAGATRMIATTQFESTDARRAFPCWDEPDRKAVFEVTLVVDDGLAAFSNSAVMEESADPDAPGRRVVRFGPTMKMSTYLVAFVVGPLEATDPVDVDGVPVRVVHAPGKGHLAPYALEVAAHSLRFFTDYFGIRYPADKLDLVAIPDFAFGAMENLGCVTFRETALLVDPASAARTELERVADVVAHEIAHMWFGDLVTMKWWEGIWLNEAFATFMEVLCVDAFRPAWRRWVSFGLEREAALAVDGLAATRPVEYPVGSPEEADGMFDVLTYQKGGSVLRMLEQYLGADTFRDGVRRYLRAHSYGNTVTADLWQALEDASGEPVRAVMDSWILQGGHPLVALDGGSLAQQPFAYTPKRAGATSAIGDRWEVPVLVRSLDGPSDRLLLQDDPVPLPASVAGATDGSAAGAGGGSAPVVVNAGGWGVYRVGYGPDGLTALAGRLADLDPLERFNLFADTWALVLAGQGDLDGFLALAGRLSDREDPSTWTVVSGALGLLDRVATDAERPAVAAATRALLGAAAVDLGWEPRPGEGERVPTLRSLLVAALGTVGADQDVRAEAAGRFDRARDGGPAIDPDIESAVLQAVTAQVRDGDYESILARYRQPANPQEELRYLSALATFPDVDRCVATFDLAVTEVRTQNAPYLLTSLLANRVGGPAVWERVKEQWTVLLDRFPVNSHSRMLDGARTLCGDPALADDVTRFLTDHPLRSGQRSVEQMLERLAVNVAFAGRHRGGLGRSLAAVSGP
ncbi:MAG TPA: M1 family metallopeptidase [Acidimicrobiales bacterium]|nr:M1 family metallopeptidase [Acidimicrobiales bacterium]